LPLTANLRNRHGTASPFFFDVAHYAEGVYDARGIYGQRIDIRNSNSRDNFPRKQRLIARQFISS
jgi:hypothetical protein